MPRLKKNAPIELNEEFLKTLEIMEHTSKNIFITGRAGTGKSTLLTYFRGKTKKRVAVLAPTGVGAVNVKGQTVHSFFRFKPDITLSAVKRKYRKDNPKNVYKKIDAIIIDEVSMVRADLLDCVDKFLRLNGPSESRPFGGIQMIFFGDLYQLPPVVTNEERQIFKSRYRSPYFFDAKSFELLDVDFLELEKIYRQKDDEFIGLLNAIRNRTTSESDIKKLNTRYDPDFEAPEDDFYIYLTTTNRMAEDINRKRLGRLPGRTRTFRGLIEGEFGREYLPTSIDLEIKESAQIMLLNNDPDYRWVNGTIGEIKAVEKDEEGEGVVVVQLSDGTIVDVRPYTWEIFRFNLVGGELVSEVIGSFRQFPIKLAWSVTIHKSQGQTFNNVIIDIGRGTFAHGQTYVALSRCTTLGGIVLKKRIEKHHILLDWRIVNFLTRFQYDKSNEACPVDEKVKIIKKAIKNKSTLSIVYLKTNDEKSKRRIKPLSVGEMEFKGKSYLGVQAFCSVRREERVFRVDRILQLSET